MKRKFGVDGRLCTIELFVDELDAVDVVDDLYNGV
jgi:hypothetical protein